MFIKTSACSRTNLFFSLHQVGSRDVQLWSVGNTSRDGTYFFRYYKYFTLSASLHPYHVVSKSSFQGGRATGDLFITLMGLISIRNLLNLLIIPGASLVAFSISVILWNYDILAV